MAMEVDAEAEEEDGPPPVLPSDRLRHVVLVTGLSGAGRSSALKYLEDLGYYWVDHLPLRLLPDYLAYRLHGEGGPGSRVAVGITLLEQADAEAFQEAYRRIAEFAARHDLVFLDSRHEILINRYRETRRRHPMAREATVAEAITREAAVLEQVRPLADVVIDTSDLTVHQLKHRLDLMFAGDHPLEDLVIFVRSFGFKYGANTDADMVMDARFLANPHYDPQLRPLTGQDAEICQFLEKDGEVNRFLEHLGELFDYLIPRYRSERKRYFTVDIGCTGGRHRSVYLVERLAERLTRVGYTVQIRHRDLGR